MARAVKRRAEAWEYIPQADRTLPTQEQTTFVLNPLTQAERAVVVDAFKPPRQRGSQETALDLCVSQIAEIRNFPAGAPQPWPRELTDRVRYVAQLDDDLVLELGEEIYSRSMPDAELGESSPPTPTSISPAV